MGSEIQVCNELFWLAWTVLLWGLMKGCDTCLDVREGSQKEKKNHHNLATKMNLSKGGKHK